MFRSEEWKYTKLTNDAETNTDATHLVDDETSTESTHLVDAECQTEETASGNADKETASSDADKRRQSVSTENKEVQTLTVITKVEKEPGSGRGGHFAKI